MSSVVRAGDVAALLVNDSSLIYEWQFFYHNLHLKISNLHGLEQKYNQSPNTFSLINSIIRLWVAEKGERATIRRLADALHATRHAEAKDVLLQKYPANLRVSFGGNDTTFRHPTTPTLVADIYDASQAVSETEQCENADLKEKTVPGGITIMEILSHKQPGERVLIVLTHLLQILTEAGDRPVTIVSINGKQRAGKSFLANQFVKYLIFKDTIGEGEWLSGQLGKTFPWRDSAERVTSGIQVWHKALPSYHNGRETAVIILDTQGLFDSQTSTSENSIIFGLSLLLSSVFIFNERHNGDDSLQNLHSFMEVTKYATDGSEAGTKTPQITGQLKFQKLILLLRDWEAEEDHDFGYYDDTTCPPDEDRNLKQRIFGINKQMSAEARDTRRGIRQGFEDIAVYAMVPPGRKLPGKAKYRESPEWDADFRNSVADFVTTIFSPEYLAKSHKKVYGEEVSGAELKDYVVTWAQLIHNAGGVIEPKSVWDRTAELFYTKRVDACVAEYGGKMQAQLSAHAEGMREPELANYHDALLVELRLNLGRNGLGGDRHLEKARELLLQKLNVLKERFFETNRANISTEVQRKQGAEAQRELHLIQLVEQVINEYNNAMMAYVEENGAQVEESDLDRRHYQLAFELDQRFCGNELFGTDSTSANYKKMLQNKLREGKLAYVSIRCAKSEAENQRNWAQMLVDHHKQTLRMEFFGNLKVYLYEQKLKILKRKLKK